MQLMIVVIGQYFQNCLRSDAHLELTEVGGHLDDTQPEQ